MKPLWKLVVVASISALAGTAGAQCVARKGLYGVWNGNDQGKYYFASTSREVWWMGDLKGFTNVFHGTIDGDIVTGSWADVQSSNKHFGSGTMRLQVVRTPGGGIAHIKKIDGTGSGFGASTWSQPCDDTVGVPSR